MIKNWQTTVSGIPALITALYAVYHSFKTGEAPSKENWEIIGSAMSVVFLAIAAKDKDVTGGTIGQTKEAEVRVDAPEVITRATINPMPPSKTGYMLP